MYTPDSVASTPNADQSGNPCAHMAQLVAIITADQSLDDRRRGEWVSALRGLGKGLRQPLDRIPTDPALLRPLLANRPAAMAGFSSARWRNIRSLTQAALAHVGKIAIPARSRGALSPAWHALLEPLTAPGDVYRLGRFGRYCSALGIAPAAVDDTVLDNFLTALEEHSLDSGPARTRREVARAWNRLGETRADWPPVRLTVTDHRNHYALAWDRLPASLRADVDAWIDHLAGRDPLAEIDFRPLRPETLRLRRIQIHLLVSALVLQGEDPGVLRTLADVVVPARVTRGLRFFYDRAGGKVSRQMVQIAGTVLAIARHWVKADPATVSALKQMLRRLTPAEQGPGMTERNRARLRPFNDPAVLGRVLALPGTLRDEVLRRGAPSVSLARQLQTAVALDLLIMIPLRMKNLRSLRLGVHLLRNGNGDMTLALPAEELKNRSVYEVPVPRETVRLIDLYVDRYRPLLAAAGSDFLFPGGEDGRGAKSAEGLRTQIQRCLRVRCGIEMHPHLFRHLAAKVLLDHDPGAYGQVQRILGHKTLNTTVKFYAGMEQAAAVASFNAIIENKRQSAMPARARRMGGR